MSKRKPHLGPVETTGILAGLDYPFKQNLLDLSVLLGTACILKKQDRKTTNNIQNTSAQNSIPYSDIPTVKNQIYFIAKYLVTGADSACNIFPSSYNEEMVSVLLVAIIYLTIQSKNMDTEEKTQIFDSITYLCKIKSDFTGTMLFNAPDDSFNNTLNTFLFKIFVMLEIAPIKFDSEYDIIDFAIPLCTLLQLIEEKLSNTYPLKDFWKNGASLILQTIADAADKIVNDKLLDG